MKTIAVILFSCASAFAQNLPPIPTTPAGSKTAAKPASAAQPAAAKTKKPAQSSKTPVAPSGGNQAPVQSIPAGAKLVEPNHYRYTDSNGKTWNYRQTPFGISRWEEPSSSSPQTESEAPKTPAQSVPVKTEPVAVTDLGDSYRFQKKTPFGQSTWTRKKSDLSDEEKTYVGQQPAPNANATTVATKPAGNQ